MENRHNKLTDLPYEALLTIANQLAQRGHSDMARVVIEHMKTKWPERDFRNRGTRSVVETKQQGGDINVT